MGGGGNQFGSAGSAECAKGELPRGTGTAAPHRAASAAQSRPGGCLGGGVAPTAPSACQQHPPPTRFCSCEVRAALCWAPPCWVRPAVASVRVPTGQTAARGAGKDALPLPIAGLQPPPGAGSIPGPPGRVGGHAERGPQQRLVCPRSQHNSSGETGGQMGRSRRAEVAPRPRVVLGPRPPAQHPAGSAGCTRPRWLASAPLRALCRTRNDPRSPSAAVRARREAAAGTFPLAAPSLLSGKKQQPRHILFVWKTHPGAASAGQGPSGPPRGCYGISSERSLGNPTAGWDGMGKPRRGSGARRQPINHGWGRPRRPPQHRLRPLGTNRAAVPPRVLICAAHRGRGSREVERAARPQAPALPQSSGAAKGWGGHTGGVGANPAP